MSGPEMLRKHRQRYGTAPSAADQTTGGPGTPSPWIDADARAAWHRVVEAAPPDLLRAIDAGTLEALAVAMVRHQRWATLLQQAWLCPPVDPAALAPIDRQAHRAAGQIAMLVTALGLSPPARSRLASPVPSASDEYDDNPVLRRLRLVTPGARHGAE